MEFGKILKDNMYAIIFSLGLVIVSSILIIILYKQKTTAEGMVVEQHKSIETCKSQNDELKKNNEELVQYIQGYENQLRQQQMAATTFTPNVEVVVPINETEELQKRVADITSGGDDGDDDDEDDSGVIDANPDENGDIVVDMDEVIEETQKKQTKRKGGRRKKNEE